MAKIWRSRDIIGVEDAQRWENKADATHRHRVSDIDGLPEKIDEVTKSKAEKVDLTGHINNRNNPHGVTKQQVGLGNVANIEQASKQDFNNHANNHNNPHGVTKQQVGLGNVANIEQASKQDFNNHANNHNNPHSVTKHQVGLGNVDNVRQASYESVEALKREFQEHEDRLMLIEYMFLQNDFTAPIRTDDSTEHTLLADENGRVIVADWKYIMEV